MIHRKIKSLISTIFITLFILSLLIIMLIDCTCDNKRDLNNHLDEYSINNKYYQIISEKKINNGVLYVLRESNGTKITMIKYNYNMINIIKNK